MTQSTLDDYLLVIVQGAADTNLDIFFEKYVWPNEKKNVWPQSKYFVKANLKGENFDFTPTKVDTVRRW